MDPVKQIFVEYYNNNYWGDKESKSGGGSNSQQTRAIRLKLPNLFRKYKIRSILDIPCGDFYWMKEVDMKNIVYTGADVVDEMIQKNNLLHSNNQRSFSVIDITKDQLPQVDLILCRDLFVHLTFEQIIISLKNIIDSNSKYLCMTHFTNTRENKNVSTGSWRPLNFALKPFEFPDPLQIINEECTEGDGIYSDKSLAVWKISDLNKCLSHLLSAGNAGFTAKKNVFTYWQGDKPALIEILTELMILHSKNNINYFFRPLTKDLFLSEYYDAPDCFELLSYPHQADVARVWALNKHGGIWLDSDTLVMNSLSSLFNILDAKNGFFITENNQRICNGVFGSRSNTRLLEEWKNYILQHLATSGPNISWSSLGNDYLTALYIHNKELFNDYLIYNGPRTMYPINWSECVDAFLCKPYWTHKHLIREYQPLVILVNSVYKALDGLSKLQILDSEYPLNYFINTSLRSLLT